RAGDQAAARPRPLPPPLPRHHTESLGILTIRARGGRGANGYSARRFRITGAVSAPAPIGRTLTPRPARLARPADRGRLRWGARGLAVQCGCRGGADRTARRLGGAGFLGVPWLIVSSGSPLIGLLS